MNLLSETREVLESLKNLNEDNFDTEFFKIKDNMLKLRKGVEEFRLNGFFENNPEVYEEFERTTKLISEEYDNKIDLWKNKINEISELLVFSVNEKKILSYKR
jgi:hypothetical protein